MHKSLILAAVLSASAMAIAQTTPQSQGNATAAAAATKPQADAGAAHQPAGPAIPATLAKSVDSKKVKAGDEIDARTSVGMTSANGVQIPQGSKIVGHVTDAKSKSKGDSQSTLAFSFEKIVLKNGQELPFHAVAQALGHSQQNAAAAAFPENGGPNSQQAQNGMAGGASPAVGASGSTSGNPGASSATPTGISAPSAGSGQLPENATGVVGLKGLNLNNEGNTSVVTADSKSVKLDEGTQLLLKVIPQ